MTHIPVADFTCQTSESQQSRLHLRQLSQGWNLHRYASGATERHITGHYKHTHSFWPFKMIWNKFVSQQSAGCSAGYTAVLYDESSGVSQNCSTKCSDAQSFRRIFTAQHLLWRSQSQINISSHFFQQQEKRRAILRKQLKSFNSDNVIVASRVFALNSMLERSNKAVWWSRAERKELKDDEGGKCVKFVNNLADCKSG